MKGKGSRAQGSGKGCPRTRNETPKQPNRTLAVIKERGTLNPRPSLCISLYVCMYVCMCMYIMFSK